MLVKKAVFDRYLFIFYSNDKLLHVHVLDKYLCRTWNKKSFMMKIQVLYIFLFVC